MVPPHSGALAPTSAGNPLRYRQQRSAGQDLLHPHRRVNRCLDQLCGVEHGVYHIYRWGPPAGSGARWVATGGPTATFRGRNCCWCYCCCHCGDQNDPPQGKGRPAPEEKSDRAKAGPGRRPAAKTSTSSPGKPAGGRKRAPAKARTGSANRPERACNRPETGPKPPDRPSAGHGRDLAGLAVVTVALLSALADLRRARRAGRPEPDRRDIHRFWPGPVRPPGRPGRRRGLGAAAPAGPVARPPGLRARPRHRGRLRPALPGPRRARVRRQPGPGPRRRRGRRPGGGRAAALGARQLGCGGRPDRGAGRRVPRPGQHDGEGLRRPRLVLGPQRRAGRGRRRAGRGRRRRHARPRPPARRCRRTTERERPRA